MSEPSTAAEHFAWAQQRALEYVDADDGPAAMASFESDLAKHPGTAGLLHTDLRNLWYADYIMSGGRMKVVREFIETLAGPRPGPAPADPAVPR